MADGLSHIDAQGHARMVDVTMKPQTMRVAVARCTVSSSRHAIASVTAGHETDILATARIIGIQAAKRTPDLIPLCHPLLIGDVAVEFQVEDDRIGVEARVEAFGQTGVEMEALTACAAAALAICDMALALDPMIALGALRVWEKRGGRSGTWRYTAEAESGNPSA
jgi:cyclic pyranopterin monophosphate synthase